MPVDHREIAFEAAIEHHLLRVAGFAVFGLANNERSGSGRYGPIGD